MSGGGFAGIFFAVMLLNAALALIPASIAAKKGRSFWGFWLFGLFFLVVALAVALLISDVSQIGSQARVRCPRCAELIASGAVVCRFCGAQFEQPIASTATPASS
jgi:hypothetical protein